MAKLKRNSNIELLRIVLMLMVISLHFNNGAMGGAFNYVTDNSINSFILYLLESFSICAVNCFMIISGYFLAFNRTVKLSKIFDLLFVVILYRLFDYLLSIGLGYNDFSIKSLIACFIPANYFAIFYIVTYIFSPYISILFDNLSKKNQNTLMIFSILIFVLLPTFIDLIGNVGFNLNGVSPISLNGNISGYTVVQFFISLLIGIYIRRNEVKINTFVLICIYLVSSIVMTLFVHKFSSLYNYCSIFTVINAVCLFLLFNKLNFVSKTVNFISKSVFPIYCIHVGFSVNELWKKYLIRPEYIKGGIVNMLICTILSVTLMFLACLIVDIIVRYTINIIKNKLLNRLPEIINVGE